MIRFGAEDGVALAMTVVMVLLLSAGGAALLLVSSSETVIAAHFRSSVEAQYAAEAAMIRAIGMLSIVEDWTGPIAGTDRSALVDGPPVGARAITGGSTLDLVAAVNLANCQKPTNCSPSDLVAVSVDRPWGATNPVWRLYAYGRLDTLLATSSGVTSPHYVMVLVADDPTASHRLVADGAAAPPREGIAVRAEAYGPRSAHAVVEVIAGRSPDDPAETGYTAGAEPRMNIVSWREVR